MTTPRRCPQCGQDLEVDAPHGLCPECLLKAALKGPEPPVEAADPSGTSAYFADFVPPAAAELAAHFPQLEILELLGKGGMGAVYKARQQRLDRLVALKILPPEAGRDPAFAERFIREARAMARLNHPHIVAVHDFGESNGVYYFIMEYVDGANLRDVLTTEGLTPAQTLQIVAQVCAALQYAHDEGIVHRDIKPENILLDRKGRVKIADFGLAKLLGQSAAPLRLTGTRQVMGTPHYMAPEQLEKPLGVDHRADIFSVGVVFYEMLTGELPLGHFALPSQKVPVDARLDEVVLRALEKEPANRYQHVSELEKEVATISTQGQVTAGGVVMAPAYRERRSGMRRYSVPVEMHAIGGLFTAYGLLRYEDQSLVMEYVVHYPFSRSAPREVRIRLADLGSITCKKSRLILAAHRLSVLREVPGSTPGQVELRVARNHRKAAEEFASYIEKRLEEGEGESAAVARAVLNPLAPLPGARLDLLRRVKGFVQSVVHYVVTTIQGRNYASVKPAARPDPHRPAEPQ